jgi:hypothetical protein
MCTLAVLPAVAAAEECSNATFRTGPSSRLPDCRAYELVTPPFKNQGHVERLAGSPDGSSALMEAFSAFAGLEAFPGFFTSAFYSTRRTASGWVTVADNPTASEYLPFELNGLTSGFNGASLDGQSTVWVERGVWQPENALDFFMRRPDRSIVDIGPGVPPGTHAGTADEVGQPAELSSVGLSADGSHLLFETRNAFWSFDSTQNNGEQGNRPGAHSLYEYVGVGNATPMLVGVDDNGQLISQCGVLIGAGNPYGGASNGLVESSHNAMSTDGNTVFFTAYPPNYVGDGCSGTGPPVAELFARIDNGLPDAHTVAISEPSEEDCSACYEHGVLKSAGALAEAHFEGASEDGSRVFFTTTQPLLGSDTSRNLYEYDFGAPAGSRLIQASAGDATVSNPTADLLPTKNMAPKISEDGSHAYFLANGVLTTVPNGQGEAAEPGAVNLYAFEHDASYPAGRIAFVARLSAEDRKLWEGSSFRADPSGTDVTPDGRFLVFTSNRDLTPDDTSNAQQVFEYDARTGALVRVSVGQDGFNHNGNVTAKFSVLGEPLNNARLAASLGSNPYTGRYNAFAYWSRLSVSADGSYVFFQSSVGLTPQAIDQKVIAYDNESPYANNIYEYHAGEVSLISDGQDLTSNPGFGSNVQLEGTNGSGNDVLFSTADRLVGQDADTGLDIYDARVDGGFPPPAVAPSCSGDACQGQLSGAPTLLSPGSEFQAGGNPPLAGPKPLVKSKKKAKKKKRKKKAKKAAVRGRAQRKAGQS